MDFKLVLSVIPFFSLILSYLFFSHVHILYLSLKEKFKFLFLGFLFEDRAEENEKEIHMKELRARKIHRF